MNAETKTALISSAILRRVAAGMTVREAVDAVCGAGTVAALIDSLYAELRK